VVDTELEQEIADHLKAEKFDEAATIALKKLGPQILGYIAATLRDDDSAYEVFGYFSEQLWKSMRSFRAESSFKTWAYKLVMHSISRYRRDGFRRLGQQFQTGEASAVAALVRDQTPPYKQTAVKDKFARLRESLEPEEQTLLFLRVDQNLSWNDVAAVMSEDGEPVDAAALRKRFERAKSKLKKLAEEQGLLDD
jgi:RNA polymerase sigma-70 factor, ECF subfamily